MRVDRFVYSKNLLKKVDRCFTEGAPMFAAPHSTLKPRNRLKSAPLPEVNRLLQRKPVLETADRYVKVSGFRDGFVISTNEREIIASQVER